MTPTTQPLLLDAFAAVPPQAHLAVDAALATRHSMRAFLPQPVAAETVAQILAVAARAPSGTNLQPWQVHVLMGHARQALCDAICAVYEDPTANAQHGEEYAYYPKTWRSPYLERRRKVGWDLYGLLGIGKEDKARMHTQHRRNFQFFDAPVGLMFTIDRDMEQGSWLDYGMFIQSVMVAARGRGLHTCPQQAFARYHRVIRQQLGLGEDKVVVCGMALGHADPAAVENSLITEREALGEFVRFHT